MDPDDIFDYERFLKIRDPGDLSGISVRDHEIVGALWVSGAPVPMIAIVLKRAGAK